MSPTPRILEDGIVLREPTTADASSMLTLIREGGVLEANTCYAYLLLCSHFADTGLVAEREGAMQGFVAAYRIPTRPDTVFVWQIGVAPTARRTGLAKRMLVDLVSRPGCRGVRYLEATVTPSNEASRRLFRSFARAMGAPCEEGPGFEAGDFEGEGHEAEDRFRIGPFGEHDDEQH